MATELLTPPCSDVGRYEIGWLLNQEYVEPLLYSPLGMDD